MLLGKHNVVNLIVNWTRGVFATLLLPFSLIEIASLRYSSSRSVNPARCSCALSQTR